MAKGDLKNVVIIMLIKTVCLVLHPHGIELTFLKFDLWSPEVGFIFNISTKGINQIKKEKFQEKS